MSGHLEVLQWVWHHGGVAPVETSVEGAWFQLLNLKYDKLLSRFGFKFDLRPYITAARWTRPGGARTWLAGTGTCRWRGGCRT